MATCPFPGMDPYLEDPAYWSDFHRTFINYWREAIADQLPDHYEARIGEQVYLVEEPPTTRKLIGPDVGLSQAPGIPPPCLRSGGHIGTGDHSRSDPGPTHGSLYRDPPSARSNPGGGAGNAFPRQQRRTRLARLSDQGQRFAGPEGPSGGIGFIVAGPPFAFGAPLARGGLLLPGVSGRPAAGLRSICLDYAPTNAHLASSPASAGRRFTH